MNRFVCKGLVLGAVALFTLLSSCQENSKQPKRKAEVYPLSSNPVSMEAAIPPLQLTPRPDYPWEMFSSPRPITIDDFRCRGHLKNPPRFTEGTRLMDCDGRHSLPMEANKESIPSVLIALLNYLQGCTGQEVVIHSGHRCPTHNTYIDETAENRTSKHQVGAEVAFYLKGFEYTPEEVIAHLLAYPPFEKLNWKRYTKEDTNVATPPWYNRDVFIKLFEPGEGRNLDIPHNHPYLSIQVRYDPTKKTRVFYSWERARKVFTRALRH